MLERTLRVAFRHRVYFTRRVFAPANPLLKDVLIGDRRLGPRKALVVLDDALVRTQPALRRTIEAYFAAHARDLDLVGPPLAMEGGERAKNSFTRLAEIHSAIDRGHVDRHSYVLAVGGGALLDLVGLAAATAHRGVRLVRLPTTTLSQADAGVGIKTGINAYGKKNFIGVFAPPFAVINDFGLLASLPPRDKRAGYAEAVKVALIRDASFFGALERAAPRLRRFAAPAMQRLIRRCAELHVNHLATSGDPFEFGPARPLDFGHWSAHKLEQLSDYRLRHGEAVAIGLALDVMYSRRMGYLDAPSATRVLALLEQLGFDLFIPELRLTDRRKQPLVLQGLQEFREHLGGRLTITLLKAIGESFEVHEMHLPTLQEAIHELQNRPVPPPS